MDACRQPRPLRIGERSSSTPHVKQRPRVTAGRRAHCRLAMPRPPAATFRYTVRTSRSRTPAYASHGRQAILHPRMQQCSGARSSWTDLNGDFRFPKAPIEIRPADPRAPLGACRPAGKLPAWLDSRANLRMSPTDSAERSPARRAILVPVECDTARHCGRQGALWVRRAERTGDVGGF